MEISELRALLTPAGLALLDALPAVATTDDVARAVSRLRAAGHPPELVSAVVGQAHLRVKARAKFGEFAARMLFTRAGLEQATRLSVAAQHAGRMLRAGVDRVADLGCGIGGDALAFAGAGLEVLAVDADEVTAGIAAYNLAPFGSQVEVRHGTAEAHAKADLASPIDARDEEDGPKRGTSGRVPPRFGRSSSSGNEAVWLDPARRTAGHSETRRVQASDYSPSLDWAFAVAARRPTGIKLGPGLDRDLIPHDVEAQWVSVDGAVVELVLWSGALTREGVRRAALVHRGGHWHELTAKADASDAPVRTLGDFIHEPDGAVMRARLIGDVARSLEAGMLDEHIAYLTGDEPGANPFVQSFRVREVLPVHVKAINRALRAGDIGTLEIKKRGMDVDPAAFRKKLTLKGAASATLILTRVGGDRVAILADRV